MAQKFKFRLIVKYSDVYGESPPPGGHFLKDMGNSFLFKAAAHLLSLLSIGSEYENYRDFLRNFFSPGNASYANKIINRLDELQRPNDAPLTLVDPIAILDLFEYCFANFEEEGSVVELKAEQNLFTALLVFNENHVNRQELATESSKQAKGKEHLRALTLAMLYPEFELLNYDITESLSVQLIKSIFLFEFLESNLKTQGLLFRFLQDTGVNSWKDYMIASLPVVFTIIRAPKEGMNILTVSRDESYDINCNFLNSLSLASADDFDDYDYKMLRAKPLVKIGDGEYLIVYRLFVIEMLYKRNVFRIMGINNQLPTHERQIKNFRSFYCDEFSERYLLYRLLNSIYKNRYIKYTGASIKDIVKKGEPDYYLRNGNKLFLFESKDVLIKAEAKASYDFNQYEHELRKKFYYVPGESKPQNKAVLQLTTNIKRALQKEFPFDQKYSANAIRIYPIVVVFDRQFSTPGVNALVNQWFQDELKTLREEGYRIDNIKQMVLVNIDSLIFHQDLLRDRMILLEDVLEGYFSWITFDSKRKYRNKDHAREYAERTLHSFDHYLSIQINENGLRKTPKLLMEMGMSLFK